MISQPTSQSSSVNPTFVTLHLHLIIKSCTILSQFTYFTYFTMPISLQFFHDSLTILSRFSLLSTCVLHAILICTIRLRLFTILSRFLSLYNFPVYIPKICLFYPILHKFLCSPSLIPQSYIHTV